MKTDKEKDGEPTKLQKHAGGDRHRSAAGLGREGEKRCPVWHCSGDDG